MHCLKFLFIKRHEYWRREKSNIYRWSFCLHLDLKKQYCMHKRYATIIWTKNALFSRELWTEGCCNFHLWSRHTGTLEISQIGSGLRFRTAYERGTRLITIWSLSNRIWFNWEISSVQSRKKNTENRLANPDPNPYWNLKPDVCEKSRRWLYYRTHQRGHFGQLVSLVKGWKSTVNIVQVRLISVQTSALPPLRQKQG